MKKHLFITGTDTAVYSRLLRSVLGDRLSYAGGYITQKQLHKDDTEEYDYYLYPACFAAGIPGIDGECFFSFSYTDIFKNTEVFRSLGKRLTDEALYYPYAVIDHFGGFELLIPEFRSTLAELLSSDIPVIGVILDSVEVEEFKNYYGLSDKLDLYTQTLRNALIKDPDTELVNASGMADTELKKLISHWADLYACLP